jgi:alkylation response protein AidB-like acyl-CoA dehydrogenase
MDLTPTPEQKMLRDAAHKYLRAEYAFDARRQLLATDTGMSAAHWRRFAEFGWLGLGLPEAHGGFGGMPDVVQVAEALGAALVVEPCLRQHRAGRAGHRRRRQPDPVRGPAAAAGERRQ